jgi:hypothetical protein
VYINTFRRWRGGPWYAQARVAWWEGSEVHCTSLEWVRPFSSAEEARQHAREWLALPE